MKRAPTIVGFTALVVLLAATVGGGAWFYRTQERWLRADVEKELRFIATSKLDEIAHWRRERIADGRVQMDDRFLTAAIARWRSDPAPAVRGDIQGILSSLERHYDYADVFLCDGEGRTLLGHDQGEGYALEERVRASLARAVAAGGPLLTDLHIDGCHPDPHQDVVVPLPAPDGEPRTFMVLVARAADWLYPVLRRWPVASGTAESLVVRREGDDVLFLSELRHRPGAPLSFRLSADLSYLPAALAVSGEPLVERTRDYRGVEVLAITRPVPDTGWYLVAKIDTDEALAEWRRFRAVTLAGIAGLVLAVLAGFGFFWQHLRKQRYRSLYHLNVRYGTTLRSIGDAVVATDDRGRVELLNPVAADLMGWSEAQARGRPLAEVFTIVNQYTREPVASPVDRVLAEGVVVGLANHTVLVARDGVERPIADSAAPIRDRDGTLLGVVLVFRDMSAQHEADRQVLEQKRILDQTGRMARIGGWEHDLATGRATWTAALYDIMGLDHGADAPGVTEHLDAYPPEHRAVLERAYRLAVEEGVAFDLELQVTTATGKTIWCRVYGEPRSVNGRCVKLFGTFQDIDQRKAAELAALELEDQLRQSQRLEAVGRLAGGVAHDFNNMLQVILGNLDMAMERGSFEERTRHKLEEARGAARRSADLTRQLLAFARKQTVTPKVLDLNRAIEVSLKMLRRLIGEDIELDFAAGEELWPVEIDPGQVDQVLANLCVNARDAIDGAGHVHLATTNRTIDEAFHRHHADSPPGDYVCLSFSDDGCGMDADILARIFDPFFTTKGLGEGTGLGLSTVHGIVSQNGGFVHAYSEPGHGTTFRLYLPRYAGGGPVAGTARAERHPRGHGETILFVEDEPALLDMGQDLLAELGYRVLPAASAAQALDLAAGHAGAIDLVITDVVMPKMNGRELAERLLAERPALRTLYVSGYTADVIARQGVLDKGVDFIAKPFTAAELGTAIAAILRPAADGTDPESQG